MSRRDQKRAKHEAKKKAKRQAERRREAEAAAKRAQAGHAPPASIRPADPADATFRQVFLGEGNEPLTDELIAELVAQGFPEDFVLDARACGAEYNRPRNSIAFPPEIDL